MGKYLLIYSICYKYTGLLLQELYFNSYAEALEWWNKLYKEAVEKYKYVIIDSEYKIISL